MSKTLIVDNGCSSMKVGFVSDEKPRIISNSIVKTKSDRKRVYVADEVDECSDHSSIFFLVPAEKGYIVNWDVQQKIWNRVFGKDVLDVSFPDTRIVMTDPIYNVPAIRDLSDEILFEQYNFHSVAKTSASSLVALADTVSLEYKDERCCIVVDSGFSFTHIVPYCNGVAVRDSIIRIDIGGKILTNLLKEWVSYRQLNVMEETFVINECKEDVCYVADNFVEQMKVAKKMCTTACEYVLPDFAVTNRGFIRNAQKKVTDEVQNLRLNVERFAVPEALFSPSDIGIMQMGIPEAIAESVKKCPRGMHGRLLRNIFLCGGNTLFDGFNKRVENDLRPFVDQIYDINLRNVDDPITQAWSCGRNVVLSGAFEQRFVTKAEYSEFGSDLCRRRFFHFI